MRPVVLLAPLMFFSVRLGLSQIKTTHACTVDSFFSDSGIGFDGHYNRCVWVFCGKRPKPGDTLRIIKLCGGMIGACPESWTLQHWNNTGWYLDRSRHYRERSSRSVQMDYNETGTLIHWGKIVYHLVPLRWEGTQFRYYLLQQALR